LFGECICTHCLAALWLQHSQVKPRFYHLLLICSDWEIHCHHCGIVIKKLKPRLFSMFVRIHELSRAYVALVI
jgi:hypothetical protein